MGIVFAAEHLELGRKVAIKLVRFDRTDEPIYAKRLRKEARTCAQLDHENIVQILDCGETNAGLPYLVMEFIEGHTLAELLATDAPFHLKRALALILQVCRALECAHGHGIVHRDLKPQNIIVKKNGDGTEQIKLLDFGIAKRETLLHESEVTLTATGAVGGTPHYIAPEVAKGDSNGDEKVDVYALGAMLYEMLSGRRPHEGDSRNAVLYSVTTKAPQPLIELAPNLPSSIVHLVHRAIESDPAERTCSARAFYDQVTASSAELDTQRTLKILSENPRTRLGKSSKPSNKVLAWTGAIIIFLGGFVLGNLSPNPQTTSPKDGAHVLKRELVNERSSPTSRNIPINVHQAAIVRQQTALTTTNPEATSPTAKTSSSGATVNPRRRLNRSKYKKDVADSTPLRRSKEKKVQESPPPSSLQGFETANPYE